MREAGFAVNGARDAGLTVAGAAGARDAGLTVAGAAGARVAGLTIAGAAGADSADRRRLSDTEVLQIRQ
ncbi:MAG: hypothetical protein GX418_01770 [Clostridiales bacterium]|nr:hypothetical protein [Clostridiales bacterium]